MTHVTCRLTAKNFDQLRNPALGNWVWAAFVTLWVANDCRVACGRWIRNVPGPAAKVYPHGWTAVARRNIHAALRSLHRPMNSLRLLPRRLPLPSPARFCQRLKAGRMRCCQRSRNGTTRWPWTYPCHQSSPRRLFLQEVSYFTYWLLLAIMILLECFLSWRPFLFDVFSDHTLHLLLTSTFRYRLLWFLSAIK